MHMHKEHNGATPVQESCDMCSFTSHLSSVLKKHIDRKHLYLRELVEEGKVAPEKVASEDNPSDALSKPLARGPAHKHRDSMLGLQVHK